MACLGGPALLARTLSLSSMRAVLMPSRPPTHTRTDARAHRHGVSRGCRSGRIGVGPVQVIEIDNAEFSYEKVVVGALRPVVIAYGTQWYSVMSSSRARRTLWHTGSHGAVA